MLSERALKRIGALERVGPANFHLPAVVGLRAKDHNPPVPGAIREDVLDHRYYISPRLGIGGVVHFHRHRHRQSLRNPRSARVGRLSDGPSTKVISGIGDRELQEWTPVASW